MQCLVRSPDTAPSCRQVKVTVALAAVRRESKRSNSTRCCVGAPLKVNTSGLFAEVGPTSVHCEAGVGRCKGPNPVVATLLAALALTLLQACCALRVNSNGTYGAGPARFA